MYASRLVLDEAGAGDLQEAQKRLQVLSSFPILSLTPDALALSQEFLAKGSLPQKAAADALHIALATIHRMDYLLTWNCKHIANAEIGQVIRRICGANGFAPPTSCTPEELMGGITNG